MALLMEFVLEMQREPFDEVLDCLEQHQIPQNILGFWVYDTESKSIHKTDLRPLMIDLDENAILGLFFVGSSSF